MVDRFIPIKKILDLSSRLSGFFIYGIQEDNRALKLFVIASNVNYFLTLFESAVFSIFQPDLVGFVYDCESLPNFILKKFWLVGINLFVFSIYSDDILWRYSFSFSEL